MKKSIINLNNKIILFIDASRNRSGGSIVYLKNFIANFDFAKTNINKIIICSYKTLLEQLPHSKNIIKYNHSFLQKNIFFQIFWQSFLLPKLLKKMKVDLLYTTDSSTFCNFNPSIVFNQDILAFDNNTLKKIPFNLSKIRLLFIRFIQIKAMNNANHVIFLSEFSKKLISNFLRGDINYSIIPHGREYVKKEFIKKSWLFNNSINLLYVSPILKYKNHEVVIKSYDKLKDKYENLKINFVGNIHDRSLSHNLISRYKTINKENFIGEINQADIKKYIKDADIFIFASSSETFGISLLEAMTQAVPIVCSNQSSLPEVLQDGGLYFDPYNYIDLSTKIGLLIEDIILRENLSNKALKISKQYSWKKNLKSFYNVINEIV